MTNGSITNHLLRYAIPLILGNLFQLTYNAVDSIIAGRFIGKEALASIGIANPVMNMIILGISGICMGAGVLMSEFFGARDYKKLKKEMSTAVLFGLYFSVILMVTGMVCSKPLLQLLRVPKELLPMATTYLRITFIGAPFTYFYNALASALKSVGDSKTPLKFLMFSAILNGVLDVIFIGFLGFGIVCSATTTVIAEAVSAILSIWYVYKNIPMLQIKRGEFVIDSQLLKRTLQYGSVTALQQSCQPLGKLLIQGSVNTLGIDTIAAYNAVTKIDDFACTPEQSISHGITTFVAQNRGANQTKRIKSGFLTGLRMEFLYWIGICLVTILCRTGFVSLFVDGGGSSSIIEIGSQYLLVMAFFYIFPAFTNGVQGYFRGMGKMNITFLGTLIQTSLRVVFTWIFVPWFGILGIAFACAVGWSVMLLVEVPLIWIIDKRRA
ncbi:MATE family efflux transporter [Anaerosporobacter sp.]|uniref:MATE family efflux transporter n=1 Tax=Anaerosporobacter sp. TaxID=1872529 RepID=UPI00286F0F85|nr:MATE family efflux transporter [Anaerosporobacter sp.]